MHIEIETSRGEKVTAVVLLVLIIIWQRWSDFFQLVGMVDYSQM